MKVVPILVLGFLAVASTVRGAENTYTLEGFIVDQYDAPVADATISLDGYGRGAISDSLGGFRLSDVPRGTYGLHVRVGCEAFAYQPTLSVPRPLMVPYPIVAVRLDLFDHRVPSSLADDDQAILIEWAFESFVREDRHPLARAFLADGVIRLVALNSSIDELPGDPPIPIAKVEASSTGPIQVNDPIPLQVWFGVDGERVLVHILRATPELPDELDFFLADRALFVFVPGEEGGWEQLDALFCVEVESRTSGAVAVGESDVGPDP